MRRLIVLFALLALTPLAAAACSSSGPCGGQDVEIVGGFARTPAEKGAYTPSPDVHAGGSFGKPWAARVIYSGCSPHAMTCTYGGGGSADYIVDSDGSVRPAGGW